MSLKICVLNCENLFLADTDQILAKPSGKIQTLAASIIEIDADIFLLSEVGGKRSIDDFNQKFLEQKFNVHHISGNSDRGIDVATLTKKTLSKEFEYKTNRSKQLDFAYRHERAKPNNFAPHGFSRDVTELWMYQGEQLEAIFLNTHLKSQRDTRKIDPNGFERRSAEVIALIELYKQRSALQGCPVFIGGDFNGNASRHDTGNEFHSIYQSTDLEDALELAGTDRSQRNTYYILQSGVQPRGIQLDYFFMPKGTKEYLLAEETGIHQYSDSHGEKLSFPPSFASRPEYPSDHLPLVVSLKL